MTQQATFSRRKQVLYGGILVVAFFLALEGVLALAGIRPIVETEDPYVGFAGMPLFTEARRPDGTALRTTADNKRRWFNPQQFPVDKPRGAFRIFAVGGSTTYGHPYDDRTSFCAWLREMLPALDPSRAWEVVNAGGVSYASYRDAALLEEFARYEPDLFIVYGSQNEFLERRTYGGLIDANPALNRIGALAGRTRIHAAMSAVLLRGRDRKIEAARTRYELSGEVDALLDAVGGTKAYVRDDTLSTQIASHYEFNLRRMARIAETAGARILYVGVASNYKDCSPFKSQHGPGLDADTAARCDTLVARGARARAAGRAEEARAALEEAVALDPRFAHAHYELGRALLALGREAEARASFERAVDEDVCPLRQTTAIREATPRVARDTGALWVDFGRILADTTAARTGVRIAGEETLLDHVHPTVEANGWLAAAIAAALVEGGVVRAPEGTRIEDAYDVARAAIATRWDARMQALGLRNVARVYNWAGKTEEAGRLVRQAEALDPQDTDSAVILGSAAAAEGRAADAIRHYEEALAANPGFSEARNNLAVELSRAGRYQEALDHYRILIDSGEEGWAVHSNAGHACMQLGRFVEAAEHYTKVVRARPSAADGHLRLGQSWMRAGKPADGERALREAVRLEPGNGEAQTHLGIVLVQQGHLDAGLEQLRATTAALPAYAPAQFYLGSLLFRRNEFGAARAALERAVALDPALPEAQTTLGLVLWRENDLEGALRAFDAELGRDPDHAEARDHRAFVLAAQGKTEAAIAEYRESLRRRPRDPKTLSGLAWLLATHPNSRYRDGREALRLAQRADSLTRHSHPASLNTLAAAQAENGDFTAAVRTAENAARLARTSGQEQLAADIERLVVRYRARQPMRSGHP